MNSSIKFFKSLSVKKSIALMISPILTTMFSIKLAVVGLALLITVDFLTGVRKSLINNDIPLNPFKKVFYVNIHSELIRCTWRKSYEYGLGIIVIAIFDTYFGGKLKIPFIEASVTETAVIIAAIIELYSVFENLRDTKKAGRFFTVVTYLIDGLTSLFPEKLQKALKKK